MRALKDGLDLSIPNTLALTLLVLCGLSLGLLFKLGLDHPFDKLVHIAYFGTATILFTRILKGRVLWASIIAVLLGAAGEAAQAVVLIRQASLDDFWANVAGISLAASGYYLLKSEVKSVRSALAAYQGRGADMRPDLPSEAEAKVTSLSRSSIRS